MTNDSSEIIKTTIVSFVGKNTIITRKLKNESMKDHVQRHEIAVKDDTDRYHYR